MDRPDNLPDFAAPPLNEVVIGVQFGSIAEYSLIRAGEVWELFRERYPQVQVQPPTPPQFETFGDIPGQHEFSIQFGNPMDHPRFWFLSADSHDLIQFEPTRLLHNWRQIDGIGGVYPRFEKMFEEFGNELNKLDGYAKKLSGRPVQMTQAEVSYINRIYPEDGGDWPFDHLHFVTPPGARAEAGGGSFQFILQDKDGPMARQYVQYATSRDTQGKPFLALSLTIRGAPRVATIQGSLDFIADARQFIVESFASITTPKAHQKWQRKQ